MHVIVFAFKNYDDKKYNFKVDSFKVMSNKKEIFWTLEKSPPILSHWEKK